MIRLVSIYGCMIYSCILEHLVFSKSPFRDKPWLALPVTLNFSPYKTKMLPTALISHGRKFKNSVRCKRGLAQGTTSPYRVQRCWFYLIIYKYTGIIFLQILENLSLLMHSILRISIVSFPTLIVQHLRQCWKTKILVLTFCANPNASRTTLFCRID